MFVVCFGWLFFSFFDYSSLWKISISPRFSLKWRADLISGNSLLGDSQNPWHSWVFKLINLLTTYQGTYKTEITKQLTLSNARMSPMTMNGFGPGVLESCQFWPRICWVYVEFLDWILNPCIWISGFGTNPFVSLTVINYAVKNFILI